MMTIQDRVQSSTVTTLRLKDTSIHGP